MVPSPFCCSCFLPAVDDTIINPLCQLAQCGCVGTLLALVAQFSNAEVVA